MSDFLRQMAQHSVERATVASEPAAEALDKPVVPLALGSFDVIAEIKSHSPAEGELAGSELDRAVQAKTYADGGAAAISVLTEPSRFLGSLDHLAEVVAAVPGTPVMRKDFLVEPVQVLEARAAGASGVLLITAMLEDSKLRSMLDCAREHGMFVLLEAFDEDDLTRTTNLITEHDLVAAAEDKLLFGVNTRNLRTLEVDPERLQELARHLPAGRGVAESGLVTADDAARAAEWGYSMALVGTALMRSNDPGALVASMRDAGSKALAA